MNRFFSLLLLSALLSGCAYFPLRPGVSKVGNGTAYVRQSQNPKQSSTQKYERITETVPPGTTNATYRTVERGETVIGASQKDTAREVSAKLSSLSSVVWIGVLVFLFGAASFVYPPIKVLVGGSVTTSAVIAGAGLLLIFLPSMLVGHELLLLGVAGGAAALYWFAHRHGGVSKELTTLKNTLTEKKDK